MSALPKQKRPLVLALKMKQGGSSSSPQSNKIAAAVAAAFTRPAKDMIPGTYVRLLEKLLAAGGVNLQK